MEHLIGHIIRALYVAPGEEQLAFVTDTATITYGVDADCCSETWFADVLGVNALLGAHVTAVADLELPAGYDAQNDGRTRQEEDDVYGHTIVTDRGRCTIIYRNSSNGYYGGRLTGPCVVEAPLIPEGWRRAIDGIEAPLAWRRITDDWSA